MLERVITGGQTGADQAGWRAARAAGVPTGGAMPHGFRTEEGNRPEFAELYGARERSDDSYTARTRANVRNSDATLWFGVLDSPRAQDTFEACVRYGRQYRMESLEVDAVFPFHIAEWITEQGIRVLNVAGNRESTEPGIGQRVEAILSLVFRIGRV